MSAFSATEPTARLDATAADARLGDLAGKALVAALILDRVQAPYTTHGVYRARGVMVRLRLNWREQLDLCAEASADPGASDRTQAARAARLRSLIAQERALLRRYRNRARPATLLKGIRL
jgi:hypothetical protein